MSNGHGFSKAENSDSNNFGFMSPSIPSIPDKQNHNNNNPPSPPTKKSNINTQPFTNEGLNLATNARLSTFQAQKVYANGWTDASLDYLESLYASCKEKSLSYAAAARLSRRRHRMLSIPQLVVGSLATATSFFSAGTSCSETSNQTTSESMKIFVAALTSLSAILGGISALYMYESKTTACVSASGSFDALAKNTQIQIYLPNDLRGPVEVVVNDIAAEFCHLTNTSPLL